MKKIRQGRLMENAIETGRYFHEKLEKYFKEAYPSFVIPVRSKGFLIYVDLGSKLLSTSLNNELKDAVGRLMPYMTTSKEEIDKLFKRLQ